MHTLADRALISALEGSSKASFKMLFTNDKQLVGGSPYLRRDALILAKHNIISAQLDKHGEVRHLLLATSIHHLRRILAKHKAVESLPRAEDSRTFFLDGKTYSHHMSRCAAYGSDAR